MITENTRIDPERIGDIIIPSVSAVLSKAYGSEFSDASQKERLLFVEAIAFCLRVDCEFNEALSLIFGEHLNLPASVYTRAKVETNEGLKLLAVLQGAIVEAYSAEAATNDLSEE